MSFDNVIGKNAKAYYNTATYTTPTWVEIPKIQDLSVPLSKNMVDLPSREIDWSVKGAGLKTMQVTFGYLMVSGADTVFDALLDSFISDTPIGMAFMNGAIATSTNQGMRAYLVASGMDEDQGLEEGLSHAFTFDIVRFNDSGTLRNPEWYIIS
jgi:aryl-phospho-beta-D-glucosidase BglC (GH1 family)